MVKIRGTSVNLKPRVFFRGSYISWDDCEAPPRVTVKGRVADFLVGFRFLLFQMVICESQRANLPFSLERDFCDVKKKERK